MTSEQLADFAGISYRQLDHWTRKGYLRVTEGGTGTGVPRQFSADEARVAQTMGRLTPAGLSPESAHRVARGETQLAPGVVILVDQPAGELVSR